jgi:hypothetical protein
MLSTQIIQAVQRVEVKSSLSRPIAETRRPQTSLSRFASQSVTAK